MGEPSVPRSISCFLSPTRSHCVGTPLTSSSRFVVKSSLPREDDGTMNEAVDYTTYWGLRTFPFENVPDPKLYGFEEPRLLTNFQLNDRILLTIVLISQPELRHRVAEISQLNQRLRFARIWARSRQRNRRPTLRHVWDPRHIGQTCLRKKRWQSSTNRARESDGSSMHSVISASLPGRSRTSPRLMIGLFGGSGKSYDRWVHVPRG
jgi:hypothetical protein